ncbi:MAG: ATP-binding protein [Myxococcota bacterium]
MMEIIDELLDGHIGRVALLDPSGRVTACNTAWRGWCEAAGTAASEDGLGLIVQRLPAHLDLAHSLTALLAGRSGELVLELGRLDERDEHFELRATPRRSGGALVAVVDVTRRQLAEDELRLERQVGELMALSARLEDSARALLHTIGSAIGAEAGALWEPDREGRLVCTTRWVAPRLLAYADRLAPEAGRPRALLARAVAAGVAMTGDVDGGDVPAELHALGLREVAAFPLARGRRRYGAIELFTHRIPGQRERVVRTLSGLGERIALFAERFRVEQTLRDIFDYAPDALLLVSQDGRILTASKAAEELTLVPRDALVGLPVEDFLPAAARVAHVALRKHFTAQGRSRHMGANRDLKLVRADGREVAVDISLSPVATLDGAAVLAAVRDVTARRAYEVEAGNRRRLESLAQMASGIAHDLEEPIDNLGALLEQLSAEVSPALRARAAAAMASLGEVVQALEQLGHPHELATRSLVDVNTLVKTTLTVSRNEWKPVAQVETELGPALPRVEAHEADLTHALFELILNAAHAVGAKVEPGGRGAIRVRTRHHEGFVEVEVEDSGIGMSSQVRSRLFEPFFSTKPPRRGRGQGLSLVKAVVESHGGDLAFDTQEGRGTTFRLRLPIAIEVDTRREMSRA